MLSAIVFAVMLAPPSPERAFWVWFIANAPRAATIRRGDEPIADELANRLQVVDPDLTFEVATTRVPRELVISAGGLKRAFPAVTRLVAAAPAISGWKVVAFRPRSSEKLIVEFGGYRVNPADVWFWAAPDGHRVGLSVYLPHFREGDTDAEQAGYLLLDGALGEYDVETKVGYIEFKPLPANPSAAGLQPLTKLPEAVDALLR